MSRSVFRCIEGHTAGNPVRLVIEGKPELNGATMSERRQDFMARYDWIRTGLCFEPRGQRRPHGMTRDNKPSLRVFEARECLEKLFGALVGLL